MRGSAKKADLAPIRNLLLRWSVLLLALILLALWATCRMQSVATRRVQRQEVLQSADQPTAAPSVPRRWYRCTMAECNDPGSPDPDSTCPMCGMKREPIILSDTGSEAGEHEITLSPRAQRLSELRAEPVSRRELFKHIRTVGKVTYDETRHRVVSAWTSGRIDRLFADYTGMRVNQGDHLVELYSPEMITAQEELLQAQKTLDLIQQSALESSRLSAEKLVQSARRKLELLGVTPQQVDSLLETGRAATHLVIHSPLGGTIIRKSATEGMYVRTGDLLYEVADLAHVWLLLDIYENDLPWVQPFQTVRVTAEAFPGEVFEGQIVFIDPVVDQQTRTIKIRVNVDNPEQQLKPGMFVTTEIRAALAEDGWVATTQPKASHACPMHTWEMAEAPIRCPICTMKMVPVKTLPGFAVSRPAGPVLSVPREAVMMTGQRALAYIEVNPGRYRGAEIRLGPLAEDRLGRGFYPVLRGLEEGQRVVTRGGFVIDSEMQIAGKPSLFHARGLGPVPGHEHGMHGHKSTPQDEQVPGHPGTPETKPAVDQIICPVMGNPIDPEVFIVYHGVRIYFCCPGCDKTFLADPDPYIRKLPEPIRRQIEAGRRHGGSDSHD